MFAPSSSGGQIEIQATKTYGKTVYPYGCGDPCGRAWPRTVPHFREADLGGICGSQRITGGGTPEARHDGTPIWGVRELRKEVRNPKLLSVG